MPGLRKSDDYIFVGAFQAIDRAIINPLFMATFFSALVVTGLSAGLHTGADERSILPWIVAALVLYFIAVIITIWVHVRRNDAIKAVGSTELMRARDLADVGKRFEEAKWASWNIVRSIITSTAAFGCLAWALVLYGRA